MKAGEWMRRTAFFALDTVRGGFNKKLLETNKREIVQGVSPEYEERRLSAILAYAAHECPFYRDLPSHARLEDFPVQTKRDFLDHYEDILSDEYIGERDSLKKLSTSGSTGTPFTVLADPKKAERVNMNFMAVMELNGFRFGEKRGEFRAWIQGKNTITKQHSFLANLKMIDISSMGDDNVAAIFEKIKKEHIQVLVTYSSALTALVNYAEKTNLDVTDWDVDMIFTMGEACPASTRDRAEKLWGIRPVLSYGNNENGFLAVSLDGADTYTADLFNFHFEILKMDKDEPVGDGELGRIVVTDLYNRAFPMIRYDTGDTGKMHRWTDEQGRVHAVFTEIYGRRGSLLYATDGTPLSIHVFMNNLLNFEGVLRQARCIQTGKKEYTLILNPEKDVQVNEEEVVNSYKKYLGRDADIAVEYADSIPIQQSGKTMVCEQKCPAYLP